MRASLCFLAVCFVGSPHAFAEPNGFTCYPVLTISEQVAKADPVILAEWVSAEKRVPGDHSTKDRTTYKVVEILMDSKRAFRVEAEIVLEKYREGRPGDLVLLLESKPNLIEWGSAIPVTQATLEYLKALPKLDVSLEERLAFYLGYLESPDELIQEDSYREVAGIPFPELQKISETLPREKLRQRMASQETIDRNLGLYGLMLGLCGTEDDAKLLADIIKKPVKDFRPESIGIMEGYLLLKGEEGLELLEQTKLKAGAKVPFGETYAALQALYFAWDHGAKIKKERLKQSMRLLLDRPEFADLAIHALARWKDWTVQDKLMANYDKKDFDNRAIKRAVVKYLLDCSKDTAQNDDQNPIEEHAITAKTHLSTLREQDPETVRQAERFYILTN